MVARTATSSGVLNEPATRAAIPPTRSGVRWPDDGALRDPAGVLPAMLGQSLGVAVQDRLDQSKFRRWTQILLVLTGLNLMRRAVGL